MKKDKNISEKFLKQDIKDQHKNTNTINEATGSEFGLTQITKFKDNPLVTEILSIVKKKFKNLEVVSIDGSGDVWHLDLRFEVKNPSSQNQFAREEAKEEAYKIKYELEKEILKKFHIPSFSIRGVNTIKGKDKTYCEFTISMIYANKGNIKVNYESSKINKYIKLLEKTTNKKVVLKEEKSPVDLVYENILKELERLKNKSKNPEDYETAIEIFKMDKLPIKFAIFKGIHSDYN